MSGNGITSTINSQRYAYMFYAFLISSKEKKLGDDNVSLLNVGAYCYIAKNVWWKLKFNDKLHPAKTVTPSLSKLRPAL